MIKLGHRGARGYCAENTLESVKKALALKVTGIEIDVHKCLTGEIIVFHDFTLDRMTNGNGETASVPLSVLKELKVGKHYKIPMLQEVLDVMPKNVLLNIELKGRHTAKETVLIVQEYIKTNRIKLENIIISSFQNTELLEVSKLDSTLQLGVLTQASVTEALSFAQDIKAYAIHPNYTLLSPASVLKAHNLGFKVFAWTVNEKTDINRIKDYKVDGIISDFPDRL